MPAGIFVFISGTLLTVGALVIPTVVLELVDGLPVELLGVF